MSVFKEEPELPINQKILNTKEEAAKLLSMSVSTVDRLMRTGDIPFRKVRGKVLFIRKELEIWAIELPEGIPSNG